MPVPPPPLCGSVQACEDEAGGDFAGLLRRLQALHDSEVADLLLDNAQLREALQSRRTSRESSREPPLRSSRESSREPPQEYHYVHGWYQPELQLEEDTIKAIATSPRPSPRFHQQPAILERTRAVSCGDQAPEPVAEASTLTDKAVQDLSGILPADQHIMLWRTGSFSQLQKGANGFQRVVQWLVATWSFEMLISAIIVANAVNIGVESSYSRQDLRAPLTVTVLENLFVIIYMVELLLRLYAFRCEVLKNNWVRFDAFLVVCGIFDFIVRLAVNAQGLQFLKKIMIIRILRLARIARVLRLMVKFQTLWVLVQGLLHSLLTLTWTMVIIVILVYIFAILGVEIIPNDDEAGDLYNRTVDEYFSSVPRCMLSLIQGLTMDGWTDVYRPLVVNTPWLCLYFGAFWLVGTVSLMNLVTAMMVQTSLDNAAQNKEVRRNLEIKRRNEMGERLKIIFNMLDTDGSQMLEVNEMTNAPPEARELLFEVAQTRDERELLQIFKMMDYDNSGNVGIDEFIDALVKMQNGTLLEVLCIFKQCSDMYDMITEMYHSRELGSPKGSRRAVRAAAAQVAEI